MSSVLKTKSEPLKLYFLATTGEDQCLVNCSLKKETGQYSMYTERLTPFTLDIPTDLLQPFGRHTGIQAAYGRGGKNRAAHSVHMTQL